MEHLRVTSCWDCDGGTGTGTTNLFSLKNTTQKPMGVIKGFREFHESSV